MPLMGLGHISESSGPLSLTMALPAHMGMNAILVTHSGYPPGSRPGEWNDKRAMVLNLRGLTV